ncbi:MAG: molecular chaperone DnaJ, partial [Atribacterota bacterium]
MNKDFYDVLGIERSATQDDVKKAYRRLARQYHPDLNPGNKGASETFKEVNEAYQVLSDPEKRSTYDRFGYEAFNGRTQAGHGGGGMGTDSDPFGDVNGFGDIFDMFFGSGSGSLRRESSSRSSRGNDVMVNITLEFEEAAFGVEKEVEYQRVEGCQVCQGWGGKKKTACPHCRGTGEVRHTQTSIFGSIVTARPCTYCQGRGSIPEDTCPECHGSGRIKKERTLKIRIPAGVDNGYRLRVSGEGEVGENGGPGGDLYVSINVKPHKILERKGKNLYYEVEVGYAQIVLGDEIEIPTLQGTEKIRIPAGTESDSLLKLKGKGLIDPGTGTRW